jgi:hypothetical protein
MTGAPQGACNAAATPMDSTPPSETPASTSAFTTPKSSLRLRDFVDGTQGSSSDFEGGSQGSSSHAASSSPPLSPREVHTWLHAYT